MLSIVRKVRNFLTDPLIRFNYMSVIGVYNHLPDDKYLKKLWKLRMGGELELQNPRTFNEKLQWLKLYDRKPIYTTMVDKYEAKKYVAERIGEEHIIPTLGVWNRFDEIEFDNLPEQFVLKCTHDSGGLVICKDKSKLDIEASRKKINKSMKRNYYLHEREWPYKNVKPRIIAEKYMVDEHSSELRDYKLMCFQGKVQCSFVCTNRYAESGLRVNFYDRDWNPMPFERHYQRNPTETEMPENYHQMVEFAEMLSSKMSFIRVDFYESNHQLFFGELTFYPGSGMEAFQPEAWDYTLGSWLKLPDYAGGVLARE